MKPSHAYFCAVSLTTSFVIGCGTILATIPPASGASKPSDTRTDTARKVRALARSSSTLGETMASAQGEARPDDTHSAMRLRAGGDGMRSSQRSAHGGAGDAIPSDSRSTGPCQTQAFVPNDGWQSTSQNNRCSGSVTGWRDSRLQMLGGGAAWKDTQDITESRWSGGYEKRERERLSVKRFEDLVRAQRTTSGLMGKPSEITYRGVLLGPETSATGIKAGRHLQAVAQKTEAGPLGSRLRLSHSRWMSGSAVLYHNIASAAAHLCGVPEPILYALISVESSWRQTDKQGRTLRSQSGALGLTQVKPSTAREVSATLDPHQPAQNAIAGACYLRRMFDRFGSWGVALKAYRVGPNSPLLHARTASDYSIAILGGAQ